MRKGQLMPQDHGIQLNLPTVPPAPLLRQDAVKRFVDMQENRSTQLKLHLSCQC
jgi:hypothetical protein